MVITCHVDVTHRLLTYLTGLSMNKISNLHFAIDAAIGTSEHSFTKEFPTIPRVLHLNSRIQRVHGHHHPNTSSSSWTGKRAARGGKRRIRKLLPAITSICTYNVGGAAAALLQFWQQQQLECSAATNSWYIPEQAVDSSCLSTPEESNFK